MLNPMGNSTSPTRILQRHFELPGIAILESEHYHGQGLEYKTPHHAEGIGFAQRIHISPAEDDGGQLQSDYQEQHAIRGSVAAMRLEEPIGHHSVFGHAVKHAVRSDDRRIYRPGKDEKSDHHHKTV